MTTVALLAVSLAVSAGDQGPWKLTPAFAVGQEIVYSGRIVEKSIGEQGAKFEQPYELEATMLVLEMDSKRTAEVGCYTVIKTPDFRPSNEKTPFENVASVHFDLIKVATNGRPTWANNDAQIMLPSEGSAPWELGYLVEVPQEPVAKDARWTVRRPGQQPIHCRIAGTENLSGVVCVKLVSIQESQNWMEKNIGMTAWNNQTTAWIDTKTGSVQRIHRDYMIRLPGDEAATYALDVQYDQASNLRYHGELYQQRVSDFRTGALAQAELERAMANTDQTPAQFNALKQRLQAKINDKLYITPYRPAIKQIIKVVEKAATEEEPAIGGAPMAPRIRSAQVGKKARSFVVRNTENDESVTLKKVKGQPVVLVFVDPSSDLSIKALQVTLSAVQRQKASETMVYAVSIKTDDENLKMLRERVPGSYSICTGPGMDKAYGIEATPHTLFIDGDGILRGSHMGLGPEMYLQLCHQLTHHGKTAENIGEKPKTPKGSFLR